MKSLIAVVAGVIVGGVVVAIVQGLGNMLLSGMMGIEPMSAQAASELGVVRPTELLLVIVAAYMLGPLSGGYVAGRLAPRKRYHHGAIVGGIQMLFGMVTLALFSHPWWFWIATLVVFIPAGVLGASLVRGGPKHQRY